MSSLTVILSSLNCDLKTDTKPNTCPTKLSRSSCNNKKVYALPIYIVTSQVNYMWLEMLLISNTQQDVFLGKQKSETNYLYYCQTHKTVNTWKISGMLIVYWSITIKLRIRKQTSKPQTNCRCCLRFTYLAPYWPIINLYFWCSRFCEFHHNWTQTYFNFQRKKKTIHISIYFTHYITCKLHVTKQKLLGIGITKSFQSHSQERDASIKSYYYM